LLIALGLNASAIAQTSPAADQDRGFTEIESFQGSVNSSDKILQLNSTVGYDFNKHFGAVVGAPLYLTNTRTVDTTGASSHTTITGAGNVYLGLAFRLPHPEWNFSSTITAAAPTGSTKKGYSTGRVGADWTNHLDRTFGRFTPFFDGGLANTVPNSPFVKRPFTSLGALGHLDEGMEVYLGHHFSAGASAYQILPSGTQKVFSQVITDSSASNADTGVTTPGKANGSGNGVGNGNGKGNGSGNGNGTGNGNGNGNGTVNGNGNGNSANAGQGRGNSHGGNPNRPFEFASVVTGQDLTREHGFDGWIGFQPNPFWQFQVGYSRSVTYHFNSVTFNIAFDIGKLIRSARGH
jgi:hypothetical protein